MVSPALCPSFSTSLRLSVCSVFAFAVVIGLGVASSGYSHSALRPNLPQTYSAPSTPRRLCKPPIIFIPGILGSRLVNQRTGEVLWPDMSVDGAKLALPISAPILALNTDDVVATEIVEEAKVSALIQKISVYGPLLEVLERNGDYRRARFAAQQPGRDC